MRIKSKISTTSNAKLRIGTKNTEFSNGKVVFSFDDAGSTWYGARNIFVENNIRCTFYVNCLSVGGGVNVTWPQLKEMHDLGFDIQDHNPDHTNMSTMTREQIIDALELTNTYFTNANIPVPRHISYPGGPYTFDVERWIKDSGLRDTARTGEQSFYPDLRDSDRFALKYKGIYMHGADVDADEIYMAACKVQMANVKRAKGLLVMTGHQITDSGSYGDTTIARLQELIDYANEIGIDIVTMSEAYAEMNTLPIYMKAKNLTITATGDGTGVASLTISPITNITLELFGNAKFYTDAAGTVGETQKYEIKSNGTVTIYIRCTEGVSYLKIPYVKTTQLSFVATTNSPILGGNINEFKMLYYVSFSGGENNTTELTTTRNMPMLSYLYISNMILTGANVNQILSDFVFNIYNYKGSTQKILYIPGAYGSGKASGQGLIDKQTLIDAGYTVTTR